MSKYLTLILFFIFWNLSGQTDSILFEDIVIVGKDLKNENLGGQTQQWSKKELENSNTNSVADLLTSEGGVFIKSYGSGTLATSSLRGGSAGHTLILWNDIPIQHPMLGLQDLSLLNLSGMDQLTIHRGGNSTMWGSGAIGGVISLSNKNDLDKKKTTIWNHLMVGEFGTLNETFGVSLHLKKWSSKSSFNYHIAKNDYPYFVANGVEERILSNAQQLQQHFHQDLYYTINKKNKLSFHYWGTSANRQIPPVTTQNKSEAFQKDESHRSTIQWQHHHHFGVIQSSIAYFNESLDYYNPTSLINSESNFETKMANVNWSKSFSANHRAMLQVSHSNTRIISGGNYASEPRENKSALIGSYRYSYQSIQAQLSIRQSYVDTKFVPTTPTLGIEYTPIQSLLISGKISRNYRLPTFNDRYWVPGGNPDLLPESGWSQEISLGFRNKKKTYNPWEITMTAFNRSIDNWILWSPVSGSPFWEAQNITKVWSRGLEPRITYRNTDYQLKTKTTLGYNHVRSTNQVTLTLPALKKGEQLWYTPKNSAFFNTNFVFHQWNLSYRHTWTGTVKGISENLEAYQIIDMHLGWKFSKSSFLGNIFIKINNLANANYRVVERRPMPMRHFQLGINLKYNQ